MDMRHESHPLRLMLVRIFVEMLLLWSCGPERQAFRLAARAEVLVDSGSGERIALHETLVAVWQRHGCPATETITDEGHSRPPLGVTRLCDDDDPAGPG